MEITTFRQEADALYLNTTNGMIKLEIWNDRVIRVVYTQREQFRAKPSLMILPTGKRPTHWMVTEHATTLTLQTTQIHLSISKATGAFTWQDAAGNLLVREPAHGGKSLNEVPVEVAAFDADTSVKTRQTADGLRTETQILRTVVDRMAYATKLALEFSPGEAIYGLGQHEEGILNYRGHHQYLYQQNMKVVAPMIVSTRGYALLWDSYAFAAFHDDVYGSYFWTEVAAEMDFYFLYGPEFDQIISEYRTLTGQAPLFPKWAYGYVQSKERYTCQTELLDIAKAYRAKEIPLDCIVLDWQSWPEGLWGQKSFDPSRFPNPSQMTADLHKLHVRLMLSIWPNMAQGGANHQEMQINGYLLGNHSTYNAFLPAARALYWQQAYQGLFQHGLDAWWCDCSEPFEADWRGAFKPEPCQRALINTAEAKKYLDPEYLNAYSLLHSQGLYEGQRSVTREKRVVNLTRSHFAGQQRYGTIVWSGDLCATWEAFRKQIAAGLNLCVTGNPKWTFDIGAFFVKKRENLWFWAGDYPAGCQDDGYRELYVRWFQMGAFLPMFRAHGTDTPREIWQFGQPGDVTYDTLVRFDFLRYRLLPYIYSLAGWETHKAYTSMRMLAFDFRHDPNVYDVTEQYLFGPALMVCPVTEPMYYAPNPTPLKDVPKTRPVYLPAGSDWYNFWTGQRYPGGQTIETAAPLDIMPLFVRAGSILPLGPKGQHVNDQTDAPLELRIYPGADGRFDLYEDEGDSYRYEQGAFAWTAITWDDQHSCLTLADRAGSFAGMRSQREYQVVLVREGHGVGLEPESQVDAMIQYTGQKLSPKMIRNS
jgi:alpha-D-xyloside xylohydrolase